LHDKEITNVKKATLLLTLVLAFLFGASADAQTKAKRVKSTPARAAKKDKINWYAVQDPDDPEFIKAALAAITETIEANFRACTEENIEALMAVHTSNCPDRELFREECLKMFADTDVYIRLVKVELIDSWTTGPNGPRVIVNVWQWTVPMDSTVEYTEYRNKSALLPKYELCEYQMRLHVENNEWKCHSLNGQIFEAHWPEEQEKEASAQSDCPDGKCDTFGVNISR
jgi:hypothetical protein